MHRYPTPAPLVAWACLAAGALLAACDVRLPWQRDRGLSFDEYVDATVALRLAAADVPDTNAFKIRKSEIEKRLHFSDQDLRDYVRRHGDDVRLMSATWDSIESRLGHPSPRTRAAARLDADSTAPGRRTQGTPGQADTLTPPSDDTLPARTPPAAAPQRRPAPRPFY